MSNVIPLPTRPSTTPFDGLLRFVPQHDHARRLARCRARRRAAVPSSARQSAFRRAPRRRGRRPWRSSTPRSANSRGVRTLPGSFDSSRATLVHSPSTRPRSSARARIDVSPRRAAPRARAMRRGCRPSCTTCPRNWRGPRPRPAPAARARARRASTGAMRSAMLAEPPLTRNEAADGRDPPEALGGEVLPGAGADQQRAARLPSVSAERRKQLLEWLAGEFAALRARRRYSPPEARSRSGSSLRSSSSKTGIMRRSASRSRRSSAVAVTAGVLCTVCIERRSLRFSPCGADSQRLRIEDASSGDQS